MLTAMTYFASPAGGPRFTDRTVLITGAAVGIGRALAHRVATEGAHVVLSDRSLPEAQEAVDRLPGPGQHTALAIDVTDSAAVDEAIEEAADRQGGLDVLVNVAGGDTDNPTFDQTGDETWSKMFDLNLMGVVRTSRAAIPHLRRSTRSPAIVNVSSINALTALGSEPYASAKAGITALTINLASSLGPDGIRVNAVAPATIRTRVWDGQPGGPDRLRHLYPLGRVGEPDDVAAAIAFLACDDAAWITGHTLPVDGGLLTGPRLAS